MRKLVLPPSPPLVCAASLELHATSLSSPGSPTQSSTLSRPSAPTPLDVPWPSSKLDTPWLTSSQRQSSVSLSGQLLPPSPRWSSPSEHSCHSQAVLKACKAESE